MPVVNIIDYRLRPYRFRKINAIIESTRSDNPCADSDQVPDRYPDDPLYDERPHVSLAEALTWANSFGGAVTLYLYDCKREL